MNRIKKSICLFMSLIMIASMVAAGDFSAAVVNEDSSMTEKGNSFLVTTGYNPLSENIEQELLNDEGELPDMVDLRNYNGKNYVTPVKKQDPFGSCWAFGIAGAAEISFLHDNGLGVPAGEVNDLIDISEKYINWYMFHAITEDDVELGCVPASQVGEGVDPSKLEETDMNAVYEFGGNGGFASNFFASGFGPVDEDEEVDGSYPYLYQGKNGWKNNDDMTEEERSACIGYFALKRKNDLLPSLLEMGLISSEDEYDAWFEANWDEGNCNKDFLLPDGSGYAPFDDWTLPLNSKYRNAGMLSYFKRSYVLPAPAVSDENGDYEFNPLGVYAMKSELANGHGVAISFFADQSQPGQESGDDSYMNTVNWAQYYTGDVQSNHTVTVVGYDDNYPKENFTRIAEGEVVEGSTPPADGAFIVKNSWGALTEDDKATVTYNENGEAVYRNPNAASWGFEDTGYFYLSYYDNSIVAAESYEFYNREETKYTRINHDQYDLLQPAMYESIVSSEKEMSANVFKAEEDEYLCQISYMTTVPMTKVHYEIYKDVQDNDPTSGVLLEQGDTVNEFGGYQRLDLSGEYFLNKGERYSVVITMTMQDDDGELCYGRVYSFMGMPQAGVSLNAVVNPGESHAYSDGKWTDWSEIKGEVEESIYQQSVEEFGSEEEFLKRIPLGKDFVKVDNLPIKAYLVPAAVLESGKTLGDVDGDGEVTIVDATFIQRKLVSIPIPFKFNATIADTDEDNDITIIDATFIQRWLAGLSSNDNIGKALHRKDNLSDQQSISLKSVRNARQLGGYRTADGRMVKSGVLIRTAALHDISDDDIRTLTDNYQVQHIIDFRMAREIKGAEDPSVPNAEYHNLDVIGSSSTNDSEESTIDLSAVDLLELIAICEQTGMLGEDMYVNFLKSETGKAAYEDFFRILLDADPDKAVLWHCTAGKDRTGIAAMLLLSALGVDEETIVKDYLLTNEYNAQRIEGTKQHLKAQGYDDDVIAKAILLSDAVDERTMRKALSYLNDEYGSILGYIRDELHITQSEIDQLKEKYLIYC